VGSVPGTGAHWSSLNPNRQYPSGRICGVDGCGTILSRYNSSNRSGLHSEKHEPGPPDLRGPHLGNR
jgi:hypothetical protein